jgi:hypothetical protein
VNSGISQYKYNFTPFQKVLVRHDDVSIWKPDFFWRRNWFTPEKIDTVAGLGYEQCIPYDGNEHLCDTSKRLEPKYQPKEGDLVAACNTVSELMARVRELEERAEKAEGRLDDCRLMRNLERQKIAELQAELRKRR